ncbi:DUF3515 domain-containing protein [Mycobacterium sp. ML4]
MIAALMLGVVTIGAILALAATLHTRQQPIAIPGADAPQAGNATCQSLMAALPEQLGDFRRADIAQPAPEGARAWRSGADADPVILRCGLPRPDDFVVGSPIQVVDRVQWFRVTEQQSTDAGRSTWYTVDRPVYVALTLPGNSGPAPIQELSEIIDRTIPAVPIDPAPAR